MPLFAWARRRAPRSLTALGLAFFLLANTAALAVSLAQARADVRAAEERAYDGAGATARAASADVEMTLQAAVSIARSVERLPSFWSATDEDRDELLVALASPQPTFNALLFYTPDFAHHGTSSFYPEIGRPSAAGRAYLREAAATGRLALTAEPLASLSIGAPVLPVAVPLREAAPPHREGFLVAGLKLDRLPALWDDMPLLPGGSLMLVDTREGRILLGTGPAAGRVSDYLLPDHLQRILAGERVFRATPRDGQERLRAWANVGASPWIAVVDVPAAAVFDPIYAGAAQKLALVLARAVLTFVVLLILWKRVVAGLGRLTVAARHWAREEWSHRAGLRQQDEIGALGGVFDRMAGRLELASAQLAARNAEREQALARREALLRVARCFATEQDGAAVLASLLDTAVAAVGADGAAVYRWDEAHGRLAAVYNTLPTAGAADFVHPGEGAVGQAAERRAPVVVNDYQAADGMLESAVRAGTRACAAVPLLQEARLLGGLAVVSYDPAKRFTADDLETIELLASTASATLVGLEQARLSGALLAARTVQHEVNNQLVPVLGFAELMSLDPALPEHLRAAAEEVARGAEAAAATIQRLRRIDRLEETHWGPGVGSTIDLARSVD